MTATQPSMLTGLHQPHCQQHLPLPGHHLPAIPLPLLQDECHQLQAQEAPSAQGNTIQVIYSLIAKFHCINLFCQDIVWSGSLLLVIIQIFKVGMNCEPIT